MTAPIRSRLSTSGNGASSSTQSQLVQAMANIDSRYTGGPEW